MDNNSNENIELGESWINGMTLIATDSNIQSSNAKFLPQTCLLNVIQMDQSGTPTIQLADTNQTVGLLIRAEGIDPSQDSQLLVENIKIGPNGQINIEDSVNDLTLHNKSLLVEAEEIQLNNDKPLGSSENPIKFIQHGETYHSTQNISQEQLRQIAEAFQLQTGKTKESTILVDPASSSSKIVYRVVYPEDLDLQPLKQGIKRGRPRKKEGNSTIAVLEEEEEFLQPFITKSIRTRSGRITKPPRHIQKAFKQVDNEPKPLEAKPPEVFPQAPNQSQPAATVPVTEQRKRPIAAQFRCPICKKAYLGRSRMLRHFEVNPDHGPIPENLKPKHDELWIQTVERAQKAPENQRAQQFCHELSRLIQNARILVPFLFKPAANGDANCYQVDDGLANALGLHPGNYSLDDSALVKDISILNLPDSVISSTLHGDLIAAAHPNILNAHNIDELILPVVDTGQAVSMNLDTSSNSDDVMNVDQLVSEQLKNLTEAELEPNMNHSLNLDLGLDLFSFNPS